MPETGDKRLSKELWRCSVSMAPASRRLFNSLDRMMRWRGYERERLGYNEFETVRRRYEKHAMERRG